MKIEKSMGKREKEKQFLIIVDRLELCKDFTINLLYQIYDYYLDNKTLSDKVDIRNHFNWCFEKTNTKFKLEGFDFSGNEKLIEYLFLYFETHFYKSGYFSNKDGVDINIFIEFWNDIFNLNTNNPDILKTLIEIYSMFDESIKNKNKVAELI